LNSAVTENFPAIGRTAFLLLSASNHGVFSGDDRLEGGEGYFAQNLYAARSPQAIALPGRGLYCGITHVSASGEFGPEAEFFLTFFTEWILVHPLNFDDE
jgi:hypothetical protein